MSFTFDSDGKTTYFHTEVGDGEFTRVIRVEATAHAQETSLEESGDES